MKSRSNAPRANGDSTGDARQQRAPGLLRQALEWRMPFEFGAALLAGPWLSQSPRGDGHPVLVFPGLLAADASTLPLRRFLRNRGFASFGWGLGRNLGPHDGVIERCRVLVRELRRSHRRRVSLVGWSLGGIYAREIAKEMRRDIRCVITLGTPFAGHPRATNAWRIYELVTGDKIGAGELHASLRAAPPVPTTSIYSRSDGVVAWHCSVAEPGPSQENIEVEASHFGLGFHPLSLHAIADRLAQPEGAWTPFERTGVRALLYPDPARRSWF